MADEHPVVVTLERAVSIPGGNHYPSEAKTFRCSEHSEGDEFWTFFETNVGPEHTVVTVRAENVRGVATVGSVLDR